MKRYHEDAFSSDEDDFEQAMAREVEGFNYFEDDDDFEHALVRSLHRTEQLGGALGPLFAFRSRWVEDVGGGMWWTTHSSTRIWNR